MRTTQTTKTVTQAHSQATYRPEITGAQARAMFEAMFDHTPETDIAAALAAIRR